ncbi:MAG: branched-chain amino acid ABC transporter permease [Candidatus Bathyarchaeia archaeon]
MEYQYLLQAILEGVLLGSIYALAAMGLALIWGILNLVNFAQADYLMLGMYATFWIFYLLGVDPLLSIPIVFALISLLGILVQRFFIRRILNAPTLTQVAATFGILLILRYSALTIWGPDPRAISTSYTGAIFNFGGILVSYSKLIAFAVTIASITLLYFFLTYTDVGIAIRATSQNRTAAELYGINIKKIYMLAFGLGTGLAGLAGALLSLTYYITPEIGAIFSLTTYVIVVLGGFRSLYGAFLGGIIVGIVECISALLITPSMKNIPAYILFLIVLLIKPTGLFGRKGGI